MPNNAPPALFVGVDGGATKTRVIVIDEAGEPIAEAIGPASSLAGSAATARRVVADTVDRALAALAAPQRALHLSIGIAGTEITHEYRHFATLFEDYAATHVVSDAHAACVGAHAAKDGAIVAIGTGVVGYRIAKGQAKRVAGWGFPQDDRGSGAWIGAQAVHAALRTHDGRAPPSALSDRIMARFADQVERLVAWACAAGAADFAGLAPEVAAAAALGDRPARTILARAGREISAVARALTADWHPELPLALGGGLAATLAPYLGPTLRARLVTPRYGAARGAALIAWHHAGFGDHSFGSC